MNMVPFRELFDQHQREVLGRLDRIEAKLDKQGSYVTWQALVPIIIGLVSMMLVLS